VSASTTGELLAAWERRAAEMTECADLLGFSADGIAAAAHARAMRICITELRAVTGMVAPLAGQVLDDQTIDAIDDRYERLERRVDALEQAVSQ
jgi:hypothetical protein